MPRDPNIVVLNDYHFGDDPLNVGSARERRGRMRKNGTRAKSRFTVEIRSEPLLHDFDELALGHRPAEAIAETLREKIRGITATVADSTFEWRQRVSREWAAGKISQSIRKRYTGGRLKETPPPTGPRNALFNFSGRLAKGIFARENKTDRAWTVNAPANRLDPSTFRNPAQFSAMLAKLQELVPELLHPEKLGRDERVRTAIVDSIDDLIIEAKSRLSEKRKLLRRQMLGTLKQGLGVVSFG